jgi:hypothetical protein
MAKQEFKIVSVFGDSGFTPDGGVYETYTNRTGASSVKGTLVVSSTNFDSAVEAAPAGSDMPIGVIYESGVANSLPVKVVVGGRAQVLLVDAAASTRGYWCGVSTATAGRMAQSATVPATTDHFREIGHSMETKTGGTNVLAWVNLHFN